MHLIEGRWFWRQSRKHVVSVLQHNPLDYLAKSFAPHARVSIFYEYSYSLPAQREELNAVVDDFAKT